MLHENIVYRNVQAACPCLKVLVLNSISWGIHVFVINLVYLRTLEIDVYIWDAILNAIYINNILHHRRKFVKYLKYYYAPLTTTAINMRRHTKTTQTNFEMCQMILFREPKLISRDFDRFKSVVKPMPNSFEHDDNVVMTTPTDGLYKSLGFSLLHFSFFFNPF